MMSTTYGKFIGVLIEQNELSRTCKILTRKGKILDIDEQYLVLYSWHREIEAHGF